jgi:NADH-quinone oxidoreductase subunit L
MLNTIIQFIILIPFIGFILGSLIPEKKETLIARMAITIVSIQFLLTCFLGFLWITDGFHQINLTELTIYQNHGYHFFIDLLVDKTSISFIIVGSFLALMVTIFSQYYMHKEDGYKRFFCIILLFYFGYNLTVLSGNFETLFLGWEVLGISSFLLIAFYRYRYLPVKNAVKVFTIYRIGDIGLILAMWLSHHFWHENVTFLKMTDVTLISEHIHQHSILGITIALGIMLAAAAKSAQFPFSYWLPRAMEGPTPSSAIFYGSLSVHMGVFLLLRTFPLIEYQTSVRVLLVAMGVFTFFVATGISRVQSSIKAQVAYSSISHIGLMFVEVALGLETLAIIHFIGNAMLRTYQLLISPSVVSYKIREQFYTYTPSTKSVENYLPKKLQHALYILCLKEWNLDTLMYFYTWYPVKWIGKKLSFLKWKRSKYIVPAFLLVSLITYLVDLKFHIHFLPELYGGVALLLALKSFSEKRSASQAFFLIVFNHLFIALAVIFNEHLSFDEVAIYISGVLAAGVFGYFVLRYLHKRGEFLDLERFHGHAYEYPILSIVFLLACLGLTGFPISPTFLGEDLIFSHIHETQFMLAFLVACSFVVDGLSLIRLYAKLFLGPHSKTYHETAYRNS